MIDSPPGTMALNDEDDGTARTALRKSAFDPDDLALLGKKLGEYRVDSILGAGGMGVVFKGEQPLIKKTVAIKVLKRALASEPAFVSRLLDEARATNVIAHPGIVDTIGFGQAPDGRPYIVMEYLEGEPLDARLLAKGKLPVLEALRLANDILAPLEAAHSAGVIHRDLKPGNVFLQRLPDGKDFPRVLDFGLARYVDSTGRGSGIVGTPSYMAPEQAKDGDQTPAIDLYALGCMLYELLSGRLPFEAGSAWGVIELHLSKTPRRLDELVLDLDDEVADLVHELLEKEPSKRPTATRARREIARLLRAREEAATIGEQRRRPPSKSTAKAVEKKPEVEKKKVDPREAATVIGLEGVDVPLPAPKSARARATELSTDVHPVVADPSESSVKVDASLDVVQTGPGIAVWIGVALGVLLVVGALVILFG
ncbi:MAG: serine/threonine protein kinase [Archangiaceae bacterium]|nr:serine/threonine protein kinase [Archangiaceae bacterium]